MSIDVAIQKLISNKTDIRKFSNSNADIAVTITYSEQGGSQTLVLDTVDDVNVRSSSTLTQHPIVDGSMVADHMFENPTQISITGSFPLEGNKKQNIELTTSGSQLANVEDLFERLKREGIRCEIVKISGNDQQLRFLRRENMVLTNISWTESINTLDYSFTFIEAQTVEVKVANITQADEDVPTITYPSTVSFIETIIDQTYITYTLYSYLYTSGIVTERFMNYLQSLNPEAFESMGLSEIQSKSVIAVVKKSNTKLGEIIEKGVSIIESTGAFARTVINIVSNIFTGKDYVKKVYDVSSFDGQNSKDLLAFAQMIANVSEAVEDLNNSIHVFQLAYNGDQECLVTIDNSYYSFVFKKNNTTNKYALTVYNFDNDPDGEKVAEVYDVTSRAVNSYDQCIMSNALFRSSINNEYVHLICNGDRSDLTNYFIVVSEFNPEDFTNVLTDVIANAVTK